MCAATLTTPNLASVRFLLQRGATSTIHVPVQQQSYFGWTVSRHPLFNLVSQNDVDTMIGLELLLYIDRLSPSYQRLVCSTKKRAKNQPWWWRPVGVVWT
mmetsp:Transcript_5223/g.14663  ORF Transcript_5223/g.14663 Transcript_5223/m.14663 type:complete len:100 (+) Transcript_5223:328-627(+)